MNKRTFQRVSPFLVFKSLVALLLFHFTLSAPVKSTISYDAFLKNITEENCAFPSGIILPFKESSTTLQFFSEPLKICNAPNTNTVTSSLHAIRLCNEIYDAIRNITCHSDENVQLPEIKIEFSDNVCKDINSLKLKHTLEEKSLLLHLTDEFVCEMICEGDFRPACQVLLWSFQLQKQIKSIPQVQSIQNTPEQENANAGNGAPSNVTKAIVKPDQEEPVLEKEQQSLQPNQEISAIENSDYNKKMDDSQQIVNDGMPNDDSGKNELDQSLTIVKDEQNNKENAIPEEQILEGEKSNQMIEKQEQTLEAAEQNQPNRIGNEAVNNAKEGTVEAKTNEPISVIKTLPDGENKINVDELPTKNIISSDSKKTVFKNKPAVVIPQQAKDVSNKTDFTKSVTEPQNNLPSEAPKENAVNVKPVEAANTPDNLKPAISKQTDESIKLQDKVSSISTPSKVLPPGKTNEAKVSIKPEGTPSKGDEIVDTKVIPTIGKENTVSMTTVADLEKMEEGNGIPDFADREPDTYNDSENDGEYSKLDYGDDAIFDSSKNKKPEELDSGKASKPALAENESPKYDFPQRNSYGRIDPIGFPEQEDSHFFFYFLSLVLLLMGGYLLFHNKQKIIALIVEGRHERRRRSHGVGYKKLETK